MAAGALKLIKTLGGNQAPKNENNKPDASKGKKDGLKSAFQAFGDWITSPSGIVTILAIVGLVLYINHRTSKK